MKSKILLIVFILLVLIYRFDADYGTSTYKTAYKTYKIPNKYNTYYTSIFSKMYYFYTNYLLDFDINIKNKENPFLAKNYPIKEVELLFGANDLELTKNCKLDSCSSNYVSVDLDFYKYLNPSVPKSNEEYLRKELLHNFEYRSINDRPFHYTYKKLPQPKYVFSHKKNDEYFYTHNDKDGDKYNSKEVYGEFYVLSFDFYDPTYEITEDDWYFFRERMITTNSCRTFLFWDKAISVHGFATHEMCRNSAYNLWIKKIRKKFYTWAVE